MPFILVLLVSFVLVPLVLLFLVSLVAFCLFRRNSLERKALFFHSCCFGLKGFRI